MHVRAGTFSDRAGRLGKSLGWNLAGAWRDRRGGGYLAVPAEVQVPALAVAGDRRRRP